MTTVDLISQEGPGHSQSFWHVYFFKRTNRHWWDAFNPSWAAHVAMASWVPGADRWLFVDPGESQTSLAVITDGQFNEWLSYVDDKISVRVLYKVTSYRLPLSRHRALQTCSTILARILSLPSSALRPVDLFHSLMADNAEMKEDFR